MLWKALADGLQIPYDFAALKHPVAAWAMRRFVFVMMGEGKMDCIMGLQGYYHEIITTLNIISSLHT